MYHCYLHNNCNLSCIFRALWPIPPWATGAPTPLQLSSSCIWVHVHIRRYFPYLLLLIIPSVYNENQYFQVIFTNKQIIWTCNISQIGHLLQFLFLSFIFMFASVCECVLFVWFQFLSALTWVGTNYWVFCSKLSKFAIVVRLYFPTSLVIVSINK